MSVTAPAFAQSTMAPATTPMAPMAPMAPAATTAPVTTAPAATAKPAKQTKAEKKAAKKAAEAAKTTATPAAATTTAKPAKAAKGLAAGQFATEAAAKASCPMDTVVWASNTSSKSYHLATSKMYGKTKHGGYECEKTATAAGLHAAKN
ncbi:MAG: hypothetical protein B7Z75_10205 [Acidocella sp. 20-57-95]|nr:MAG: hypothetical protein B7Z75_10205 [Acidocella sp. 20-57-95]